MENELHRTLTDNSTLYHSAPSTPQPQPPSPLPPRHLSPELRQYSAQVASHTAALWELVNSKTTSNNDGNEDEKENETFTVRKTRRRNSDHDQDTPPPIPPKIPLNQHQHENSPKVKRKEVSNSSLFNLGGDDVPAKAMEHVPPSPIEHTHPAIPSTDVAPSNPSPEMKHGRRRSSGGSDFLNTIKSLGETGFRKGATIGHAYTRKTKEDRKKEMKAGRRNQDLVTMDRETRRIGGEDSYANGKVYVAGYKMGEAIKSIDSKVRRSSSSKRSGNEEGEEGISRSISLGLSRFKSESNGQEDLGSGTSSNPKEGRKRSSSFTKIGFYLSRTISRTNSQRSEQKSTRFTKSNPMDANTPHPPPVPLKNQPVVAQQETSKTELLKGSTLTPSRPSKEANDSHNTRSRHQGQGSTVSEDSLKSDSFELTSTFPVSTSGTMTTNPSPTRSGTGTGTSTELSTGKGFSKILKKARRSLSIPGVTAVRRGTKEEEISTDVKARETKNSNQRPKTPDTYSYIGLDHEDDHGVVGVQTLGSESKRGIYDYSSQDRLTNEGRVRERDQKGREGARTPDAYSYIGIPHDEEEHRILGSEGTIGSSMDKKSRDNLESERFQEGRDGARTPGAYSYTGIPHDDEEHKVVGATEMTGPAIGSIPTENLERERWEKTSAVHPYSRSVVVDRETEKDVADAKLSEVKIGSQEGRERHRMPGTYSSSETSLFNMTQMDARDLTPIPRKSKIVEPKESRTLSLKVH